MSEELRLPRRPVAGLVDDGVADVPLLRPGRRPTLEPVEHSPVEVDGADWVISRLLTGGSQPFDITVGPDGNLWFTEFRAGQIGFITPTGGVTEFTIPTAQSAPAGITLGPDGNLWFTENQAHQIGRVSP